MGNFFKTVDSISLNDDTYDGLSKQIKKLIRGTEYHEEYRQKGNFVKDTDTKQWKVELEYSVMNGVLNYDLEGEEIPAEDLNDLESAVGLELLLQYGVEEAKEYLGYEPKPNDEFLTNLENQGLSKVANEYGVPDEALLAFQGLNINGLREYFDFSLKGPIQKRLAKKLDVTVDFLKDLKKRKLA